MIDAITDIYRRAFALILRWPWLIALPVLAEGAQHIAEIRLGMYTGTMTTEGQSIRLAFGLVKMLSIVVVLILAWRLWRFEGDLSRVLRPTGTFARGFALFILIQLAGDLVAMAAGRGLSMALGSPSGSVRLVALLPMIGWILVSLTLFPWYVALATEDRALTLTRSFRAMSRRIPAVIALLLAGALPLMALHYALGYAALGGAPAWPLMLVDTGVVGLLAACMAATYYTLYLWASHWPDDPASAQAPSRV